MRKTASLCVALASLFVVAVPSQVTAAPAIFHDHNNFTDSFPGELCGIAGTFVRSGVGTFTVRSNNSFSDHLELNLTFTSTATHKSVVLHVAQTVTGNAMPIDNGDGTMSFINTFKGLPEQIRIANGPVLLRDAGTVTFTFTFSVDADGNFIFASDTFSVHGPHPDLLSDFALFCDVVIPALS